MFYLARIFCTFLMMLLFTPPHTPQRSANVPKHKRTTGALTGKRRCVWQISLRQEVQCWWLLSSMSTNQQYILYRVSLNGNVHNTRLYMHWLVDENVSTTGSQKPNPVFPLAAMVQYSRIHCLWELHRTSELQKIKIYRVCVCVKVYLILDTHTHTQNGSQTSLKAHAWEHKKPRKRVVKWQGWWKAHGHTC